MAKSQIVLTKKGFTVAKAASRSLTFVGFYKGMPDSPLYSTMGIEASWDAYQRERRILGLATARKH